MTGICIRIGNLVQIHTEEEDGMKTQGEDDYQQTKEREASKEASFTT